MARKINSEVLMQFDPAPVFKRLYDNALGNIEGGLTQGEVISCRAVLMKYWPDMKAIEHKVDEDTLTSLAIYKGNAPKPTDN
jgi:chorismate synthase